MKEVIDSKQRAIFKTDLFLIHGCHYFFPSLSNLSSRLIDTEMRLTTNYSIIVISAHYWSLPLLPLSELTVLISPPPPSLSPRSVVTINSVMRVIVTSSRLIPHNGEVLRISGALRT
jgi:hypothetical protein